MDSWHAYREMARAEKRRKRDPSSKTACDRCSLPTRNLTKLSDEEVCSECLTPTDYELDDWLIEEWN